MKYTYKRLDINCYINSLYTDELHKLEVLSNEEIRTTITDIGILNSIPLSGIESSSI